MTMPRWNAIFSGALVDRHKTWSNRIGGPFPPS
jgi:hypothetical protein